VTPTPEFEDLPFYERPDLTPYLIHLTTNTKAKDENSAFDILVSILKTGKIRGGQGFIKGQNPAACFMDVPFYSLKYILNKENTNVEEPRYEPFGIFVTKKYAYSKGCRPVLYLANKEVQLLRIPDSELWRVVRFEVSDEGWISWLHEREWRVKGDFALPSKLLGVLVRNPSYAEKLQKLIAKSEFKVKPRSVIPLTVLCQGLPLLRKG